LKISKDKGIEDGELGYRRIKSANIERRQGLAKTDYGAYLKRLLGESTVYMSTR